MYLLLLWPYLMSLFDQCCLPPKDLDIFPEGRMFVFSATCMFLASLLCTVIGTLPFVQVCSVTLLLISPKDLALLFHSVCAFYLLGNEHSNYIRLPSLLL